MREIKFRGKSELGGEWRVGDFLTDIGEFDRTCDKAYIAPHWDKLNIPIRVVKETVGQFTGLKDKNGMEIYEGDIVENPFSIAREFCYKVIWYEEDGQWCFDPFMKGDQDAPLLGIEEFVQNWETVQSGIEVIGNIYENPELINS